MTQGPVVLGLQAGQAPGAWPAPGVTTACRHAGRDPNLVYGVWLIEADQRVIPDDRRHLVAQVGEHDLAGG